MISEISYEWCAHALAEMGSLEPLPGAKPIILFDLFNSPMRWVPSPFSSQENWGPERSNLARVAELVAEKEFEDRTVVLQSPVFCCNTQPTFLSVKASLHGSTP